MTLCKCGCGYEVKEGNEFILGHNGKGKNNGMYGKVGKLNHNYGKHWSWTKESKDKIMGENNWNYGKIGKLNPKYGNKWTEEQKEGRRGENNPMYGKVGWNKGLTKETDERVRKSSEKVAKKTRKRDVNGKKNPFYGRKHIEKTKKGIGISVKKLWENIEYRDKMLSEENIKKRLKGLIKKPNKKEQFLIELIQKNNFNFNYVGDGEKIISGKNPDFISFDDTKIIELYGDYWHRNDTEEDIQNRISIFTKCGYETLIIWEHELENPIQIVDRIGGFIK